MKLNIFYQEIVPNFLLILRPHGKKEEKILQTLYNLKIIPTRASTKEILALEIKYSLFINSIACVT